MIEISDEAPGQQEAIGDLHRAAFGGDFEARLVRRLQRGALVAASLVATDGGKVVGHILFSDLAVEVDGRPVAAVSLAPLAVLPERQRSGIGTRLVQAGLESLRARQRAAAVIVLGEPGYYQRFGFSAELARKLASPYAGEACMALELLPGALAGHAGRVTYPAAFAEGD